MSLHNCAGQTCLQKAAQAVYHHLNNFELEKHLLLLTHVSVNSSDLVTQDD